MDFKKLIGNKTLIIVLLIVVICVVVLLIKPLIRSNDSIAEDTDAQNIPPVVLAQKTPIITPVPHLPASVNIIQGDNENDAAIQEQLDRDRKQQKETNDLKNKLEQTNLELEQEKAIFEINKLKKENMGSLSDPTIDGQSNLPHISIDYIGGDSVSKEAILSIGGASYQVKNKSMPTDNIQVLSITDSNVTLHFNAPVNYTKTIEYKPE